MNCATKEELPESFLNKVNFTSGCWLWTGCINHYGYGHYKPPKPNKLQGAHRYAWTQFHGEIPKGMFVCHKCDVRNCVNPEHLFIGTNKDNMDDKMAKGRQSAAKGEASGNAKLTQRQVEEIRRDYKRARKYEYSEFSHAGLAMKYGVSSSHICRIINNKIWRVGEMNEPA